MKICLIAEGSYPYITGGVSSWIQMLVSLMPEHEFIIYAIGAEEKERGKFKYELPKNITMVKEIFLDSYLGKDFNSPKKFYLNQDEKKALKGLIAGEDFEWKDFFRFINKNNNTNVLNLLMSKDYLDLINEISENKYSHIVFNNFFWTVRSMMLPLLEVLSSGIPRADIYHSVSTGYAGVVGALGKYIYGSPLLLTEHGIYTREREEEIIKSDWLKGYLKGTWIGYFYNLSRCAYEFSDIIVSLFEKSREIQIEMGADFEKTMIIPNGINCEAFKNENTLKEDKETINIGAILRVVPIKDVITLIEGFGVAYEKIKNIKLYIMGPSEEDEDYSEECRALVDSMGLNNIVFTGQVEVKDYIGRMDILILSSISEGQPLSVLEGMAAGKPHILTDVGSCSELMYGINDEFGRAGIIVSVMDYRALGESIIKLCKDKALRNKMGNNAHSRVSKLYTIEKFIESYRSIYREMVKR